MRLDHQYVESRLLYGQERELFNLVCSFTVGNTDDRTGLGDKHQNQIESSENQKGFPEAGELPNEELGQLDIGFLTSTSEAWLNSPGRSTTVEAQSWRFTALCISRDRKGLLSVMEC